MFVVGKHSNVLASAEQQGSSTVCKQPREKSRSRSLQQTIDAETRAKIERERENNQHFGGFRNLYRFVAKMWKRQRVKIQRRQILDQRVGEFSETLDCICFCRANERKEIPERSVKEASQSFRASFNIEPVDDLA